MCTPRLIAKEHDALAYGVLEEVDASNKHARYLGQRHHVPQEIYGSGMVECICISASVHTSFVRGDSKAEGEIVEDVA